MNFNIARMGCMAFAGALIFSSPNVMAEQDRPWYDVKKYFDADRTKPISKESLFGRISGEPKNDQPLPIWETGQDPALPYSTQLNEKTGAREFISFDNKGSMYLSENTLDMCKSTIHVVTGVLKTHKVEEALMRASIRRNVAVRLIVNEPKTLENDTRLFDLRKAGVEVRVLVQNPILESFAVCDGKTVLAGTIESFDNERYSYGVPSTRVTYNNTDVALNYERQWAMMWGHAVPHRNKRNKADDWYLFGAQEEALNKPIKSYRDRQKDGDPQSHYHIHGNETTLFR